MGAAATGTGTVGAQIFGKLARKDLEETKVARQEMEGFKKQFDEQFGHLSVEQQKKLVEEYPLLWEEFKPKAKKIVAEYLQPEKVDAFYAGIDDLSRGEASDATDCYYVPETPVVGDLTVSALKSLDAATFSSVLSSLSDAERQRVSVAIGLSPPAEDGDEDDATDFMHDDIMDPTSKDGLDDHQQADKGFDDVGYSFNGH
eukprot:GHVT01015864.1.p1 GENE.GHVT01015864.1~~GHVT01015864.1.p1  ORF type:complete len:201 (-),score=57.99 GHVT01015864.1:531-1133(-)